MKHDAVLLLGFGGPQSPEEIRPFLDRVLKGRPVPNERYEEVVRHYECIGGKSPFNERTQQQAHALQAELQARASDLPVRVAYRNAPPFIEDVAKEYAERQAQFIAVILSAYQSEASWDRYARSVPNATFLPPFFEHPLFVEAQALRLREAMHELGRDDCYGAAVVFTAHSIPTKMAQASPYVSQFQRSAELIAAQADVPVWALAYQSRSGSPGDEWLEPDIRDVLRSLPPSGIRDAIVVPIGFICEHVELLYDLDIEAANVATDLGLHMARAAALNDHPLFIRMLAHLVLACEE